MVCGIAFADSTAHGRDINLRSECPLSGVVASPRPVSFPSLHEESGLPQKSLPPKRVWLTSLDGLIDADGWCVLAIIV
jgi:hypothetical protein